MSSSTQRSFGPVNPSDGQVLLAVERTVGSELSQQGFRINLQQFALRLHCESIFSRWSPDLGGLVIPAERKEEVLTEIGKERWLSHSPQCHHLLVSTSA